MYLFYTSQARRPHRAGEPLTASKGHSPKVFHYSTHTHETDLKKTPLAASSRNTHRLKSDVCARRSYMLCMCRGISIHIHIESVRMKKKTHTTMATRQASAIGFFFRECPCDWVAVYAAVYTKRALRMHTHGKRKREWQSLLAVANATVRRGAQLRK